MEIQYFKHKGLTPYGLTYVVMEHARKRLHSLKFAYFNLPSSAVNIFVNELQNKYLVSLFCQYFVLDYNMLSVTSFLHVGPKLYETSGWCNDRLFIASVFYIIPMKFTNFRRRQCYSTFLMCPSNVLHRAWGRASERVLASAEDVSAKYLSRELQPPAVDALFNTKCCYATF